MSTQRKTRLKNNRLNNFIYFSERMAMINSLKRFGSGPPFFVFFFLSFIHRNSYISSAGTTYRSAQFTKKSPLGCRELNPGRSDLKNIAKRHITKFCTQNITKPHKYVIKTKLALYVVQVCVDPAQSND